MSTNQVPTVLIAYPQEFSCFEKFERKLSNILSNFSHFDIAYQSDYNDFILRHLSSDKRIDDALTSTIDEEHLENITHAIIFDDGESFNKLIQKTKSIGIKSRIIETELTKVVNIDKGKKHDV